MSKTIVLEVEEEFNDEIRLAMMEEKTVTLTGVVQEIVFLPIEGQDIRDKIVNELVQLSDAICSWQPSSYSQDQIETIHCQIKNIKHNVIDW